jgi:hexulose-6-phosphate isomerase
MQRREFVKRVAAGLVGVGSLAGFDASPTRVPPRPQRPRGRRLKKAIKLHLLNEDLPLAKSFRLLREVGFEGVELRCPNEERSRSEVLQARDQTGLSIHGVLNAGNWGQPFSSPDPAVRAKGAETLKAAIADAAAYGASTVLLIPAVVTSEVSYDEAWHRSQEAIRTVLPTAEKHNVTIAFENVWNHFLLSPLEFARYIDAFESDHVGAYLDIGNTLTYGWPEQWLRILGDRVVKIHMKDRTRERYSGRGQAVKVKLGEGSCDWAAVQEALADIGYAGWATAEVQGGDRARMRDISDRMSQVLSFS